MPAQALRAMPRDFDATFTLNDHSPRCGRAVGSQIQRQLRLSGEAVARMDGCTAGSTWRPVGYPSLGAAGLGHRVSACDGASRPTRWGMAEELPAPGSRAVVTAALASARRRTRSTLYRLPGATDAGQ